jgi:hypothetical protein
MVFSELPCPGARWGLLAWGATPPVGGYLNTGFDLLVPFGGALCLLFMYPLTLELIVMAD